MRGRGLGIAQNGTWCEVIAAPNDAVQALPAGIALPLGAAFFSPCTSAWVALREVGQLRGGERLLVTGASGAVGSITVQLALELGAQVQAVVREREQAARLPAGVTPVFEDRLADAQPSDLLIDTVGGAVLAAALARGRRPRGAGRLHRRPGRSALDLPSSCSVMSRCCP